MSMYSGPDLKLDRTALSEMLDSPTGEVGRHLRRLGELILVGARGMVGVDSGRLKRSLNMKHKRDTRGQYVEVGSDMSYALAHHEGTRPRVILPETGRVLRFRVGARVVYAKSVKHPGTRGRKYLTVPLERVVR